MKQLLPIKIGKTFLALFALVLVAAVTASLGAAGTPVSASVAFLGLFGSTKRLKKSAGPKKMIDIDLEFISILTDDQRPANGLPVLVKSVDGKTDKREVRTHVVHKDVAQGLLYATTYEPGKVDAQNDTTDAAEIQKMAHNLAINGRFANLDVNHNLKKSGSHIVESYILRGEDPMFPNIEKGAHCIVVQLSEELKAKAADITGVSIYGTCKQVEKADETQIQKGNSEWLRDLRSADGLEIGDTQMAKALGLALADYTMLESGEADFEWTPEAIDAVAKLTKQKPSVIAASALNGKAPEAPAMTPEEQAAADQAAADAVAAAAKSVTPTPPTKTTIEMEKKTLKSKAGVLPVTGGAGAEVEKSLTERRKELYKAMTTQVVEVKKGVLEDGILDEGGTVKPELGRTIVDLSLEASAFLRNIQVIEMNSLKEDVAVFAVSGRKARRFDVRDEVDAADLTETDNLSITMSAADVDFAYNIPNSLVNNYRGRFPQLEAVIGGSMMNTFTNDLVDLGFNGTTDTYASSFLTLAKGWLTIAQAAGNAWQIVDASSNSFTVITESFDKAITNMAANNPKYSGKETAFVISAVDFENLELELLGMPGGFNVAVDGAKGQYRGHPVFVENSIPEGYFLYTKMSNFVVGIVTQGSNGMRTDVLPKTKSKDFILSAAVDYAFVDDEGYVVGKP